MHYHFDSLADSSFFWAEVTLGWHEVQSKNAGGSIVLTELLLSMPYCILSFYTEPTCWGIAPSIHILCCYHGGWKTSFILSTSEIVLQKWYHCFWCTMHYQLNLILRCYQMFSKVHLFVHAIYCYTFLCCSNFSVNVHSAG